MTMNKFFILSPVCLLVSCGGNSDATNSAEGQPRTPFINQGGAFSNPSPLSFDFPNAIGDVSADNYFSFSSESGARLILHAELSSPLDMKNYVKCADASSYIRDIYYAGMIIEDTWQSCSIDLSYQFTTADEHVLRVAYPYNNPGEFNAALFIPEEIINAPISPEATGRPDNPMLIKEGTDNNLQANNFYNYYAIPLNAGDEIRLHTYPNNLPSGQESSRCESQASLNNYQGYGISVDYGSHNCSENITLTATESKTYIFHFKFTENDSSGYFRASVRRN